MLAFRIVILQRVALGIPLLLFLFSHARAQCEIDALQWMAGSWELEGKAETEEHWTSAAGGMMLGMHRDVKGSRSFFEYLRIEQRADSVFYIAAPMGGKTTEFLLVECSPTFVRFENHAHDYPVRIEYERHGRGGLTARISGVNGRDARSWRFVRRKKGLLQD
ncbi:hypothetical protein KQI65_08170 [bacterium]|nr:hypothetical protein [bacterium]